VTDGRVSAHPIFDEIVGDRHGLLAEALAPTWPGEGAADIWQTAS
jgi:hypothetical protein